MRLTKFYIPALKEAPADAEIASHKLMIRAGFIRKLAAGVYSLLPAGVKVIRKIEAVIREEMNRAGALEVYLPSVQPASLWEESGRWEVYGKELLRITDRHNREFCYGPTHEEVITDLVRRDVRSYRDLPLNLYQIQTKFRDEIRPRFGVMRAREFSMKDAYSFDADEEGAKENYEAMRKAYTAIFSRLGLKFRAVEADTGQIGGSASHEFMVLAETGEDRIAHCDKCGYAANVEKVELSDIAVSGDENVQDLQSVDTPNAKTIEEVSEFLDMDSSRFIKTLIYKADGNIIAVLIRGDYEVNETKLLRAIDSGEVALASEEEVESVGTMVGFAGPVGLENVRIIADSSVKSIVNGVTGANRVDTHFFNVNPGKDFTPGLYADIREAVPGDPCPRCDDGKLSLARGIEVGHIFQLGVKYSEAMKANFLNREGKERPMIMGCYGIGVGRTGAASIEQNHDDNGIIWPPSIAPFDVVVLPLSLKDEEVVRVAESIYEELKNGGFDPALDDRNLRPGVKFNESDLVGYPLQVVVGRKGLADGVVEVKIRKTGERMTVAPEGAFHKIKETLEKLSSID